MIEQLPPLAQAMREVLADVDRHVRATEGRWPRLVLTRDAASMYGAFPAIFAPAYAPIDAEQLRLLTYGTKFIASAIVTLDHSVDRAGADVADLRAAVLSIGALEFEGYRRLSAVFHSASPFWIAFGSRFADVATGLLTESDFSTGVVPLRALDATRAHDLILAKTGIAKFVLDALAELSGAAGPTAQLAASVDAYHVARQMLDDLIDWRTDLRERVPSLVLARLLDAWPAEQPSEAELLRLARVLYRDGIAAEIVDYGLAQLAPFDELVSGLGLDVWRDAGRDLLHVLTTTRQQIAELALPLNEWKASA